MAQLLCKNGTRKDIQPANGTDFQIKELYNLLDCSCVEILRLPENRILIFDEEGKLKPDPEPNVMATALTMDIGLAPNDYIVGNALLCKEGELQ